jgi:hypothetical protein
MTRSQQIKSILVQLAANDQLPSDMTTLDEHIFDVVFNPLPEGTDLPDDVLEKIEQSAEKQALDGFLTEYPDDMEYNEILERLSNDDLVDDFGDTLILVWEPFEREDPSKVSEYIENSKDSLVELLKVYHRNNP